MTTWTLYMEATNASEHAGNNQLTRLHIHLTIQICDSLNARISLYARNASILSTTNNAKRIRSRVIYHLKLTLINDNPAEVPTIINSQNAHVHTWHVIFGPAVGWNSHKNMHLNKPSKPHPSPSPTPSAMFTTTHEKTNLLCATDVRYFRDSNHGLEIQTVNYRWLPATQHVLCRTDNIGPNRS